MVPIKLWRKTKGGGNIFFGGALMNFDITEAVAAHSKRMAPIVAKFLKEKDCSIVDELIGDGFK